MLIKMRLPKFYIYHKLKQTQIHYVLIFFNKTFRLMSSLKLALSNVTYFLADNLSSLENIMFRAVNVNGNIGKKWVNIKTNELLYIASFVVSGSIKKLFWIHYNMSVFTFSQYYFSRFCPVEKCRVATHWLYPDSLILIL